MVLKSFRPEGVSIGDVARNMGRARSTVQKMETSENPGVFTVKQYAEAVGKSPLEVIAAILGVDEKSVQNA
ncbi:helix-turn-helix domain-containing protein [Armatimonas rosea]|uniref:Plasmid maintenance system antidote protein VapI n=1 Tax=Armatimonas rosea TaxID=685828 RepID=A0A7W9W9K3_ARMRO|nr:helix-turn-helix transcriptional regulator [Armatimonas rosea]MBB6053310.1 plasmid maintenance system antidote protein VapI [Armatimonas rosea]